MTPIDPQSIDGQILNIAKRRQLRERVSVICAGIVVTVMVVTFYSILAG